MTPPTPVFTALTALLIVGGFGAPAHGQTPDDPLAETFARELRPAVESLLIEHRSNRKYAVSDFPLSPERFERFQQEIVSDLIRSLHLEDWVVRSPEGGSRPASTALPRPRREAIPA